MYYATRAVKRNVGRDRFEVKHEITDGDERTRSVRGGEKKRAYEKTVGIKIKRTEAAGKQRVESYDSAVPSRPGNYWLNLEEKERERERFMSFLYPVLPRPWISISLKERETEREIRARRKTTMDKSATRKLRRTARMSRAWYF